MATDTRDPLAEAWGLMALFLTGCQMAPIREWTQADGDVLASMAAAGLALREALPSVEQLGMLAELCERLDWACGVADETEIQDAARGVAAAVARYDAAMAAAMRRGGAQ